MHLCFVLQDEQYIDITMFHLMIIEASPVSKAEKRAVLALQYSVGPALIKLVICLFAIHTTSPQFSHL